MSRQAVRCQDRQLDVKTGSSTFRKTKRNNNALLLSDRATDGGRRHSSGNCGHNASKKATCPISCVSQVHTKAFTREASLQRGPATLCSSICQRKLAAWPFTAVVCKRVNTSLGNVKNMIWTLSMTAVCVNGNDMVWGVFFLTRNDGLLLQEW